MARPVPAQHTAASRSGSVPPPACSSNGAASRVTVNFARKRDACSASSHGALQPLGDARHQTNWERRFSGGQQTVQHREIPSCKKRGDTNLVILTTRLSSNPTLPNRQLIRTRGARGACDRRASALSATEQLGVHSSTSARYRGWDVEASMTSTVSSCVCFCPTSTAGAPAKTSSMRSGPSSEAYETEGSRFVLGPRPHFGAASLLLGLTGCSPPQR